MKEYSLFCRRNIDEGKVLNVNDNFLNDWLKIVNKELTEIAQEEERLNSEITKSEFKISFYKKTELKNLFNKELEEEQKKIENDQVLLEACRQEHKKYIKLKSVLKEARPKEYYI
ncbi:hypothetical protein AusDCA_1124 [Desulfitobacterium sp. AusDCA]